MPENLEIKNTTSAQDPRKVLEEVVKEIREGGKFGRREAVFLLLDELLKEQIAEIN